VDGDDTLRRWMSWELHRLNAATVVQPMALSDLLRSAKPHVPTRDGGVHEFDAGALRKLAADVPPHLHHRLRLPITVYEPHDTPGEGYVQDTAAVEALGALGAATSPREGRLWMSLPLARVFAERYPTAFQSMSL